MPNPLLANPIATVLILAAGFGFICDFTYRAIVAAINMGRPWIVTLPGTPGAKASIQRRSLKQGLFTRKQGDEQAKVIAAGMAAYPTTKGPIHILTDYGANLIAPSKDRVAVDIAKNGVKHGSQQLGDEKLDNKTASEVFLVWDPLTYGRATRENDMEDLYAAQQNKPHWMEKVAPFLMIAVLALVGLVGFMLYKLMPLIQGASA